MCLDQSESKKAMWIWTVLKNEETVPGQGEANFEMKAELSRLKGMMNGGHFVQGLAVKEGKHSRCLDVVSRSSTNAGGRCIRRTDAVTLHERQA